VRSEISRFDRDLGRQLTRAAWSIQANIAEDQGRGTALDFASFIDRARGSLFETDSWLLAAKEMGCLSPSAQAGFAAELLELNAMLRSLRNRLREQQLPGGRRPN
jgi:four helix bundle protein